MARRYILGCHRHCKSVPSKLIFGNSAAGTDYFGFDDFSIGCMQQVIPTPEPTTMLLLGLGLLGLAGLRKRD